MDSTAALAARIFCSSRLEIDGKAVEVAALVEETIGFMAAQRWAICPTRQACAARDAAAGLRYLRVMTDAPTKDSNGNLLAEGDSVTLIKDLKVKGSGGVTLKRGTMVKNIRLTDDPAEIEANVEKVRGLVLRTEFVRKA